VLRYNQALVEAFSSRDQERLVKVATEAERNRVGAIIAGLQSQGRLMLARRTSERTLAVKRLEADLFEVTTLERWEYEHRQLSAPQTPVQPKTLTYVMAYQVRRMDGAWVVQHAQAREEQPGAASR
jgi:hypothetical protein